MDRQTYLSNKNFPLQLTFNGVTNSLHIMEHLAMHNKVGHSHLSTCYHHLYKYAGFKW